LVINKLENKPILKIIIQSVYLQVVKKMWYFLTKGFM